MQRMPNINLTPEEYKMMVDYCRLERGGEGIICKGMRPDTLYKIFVEYDTTTPTGLSDNKFKKIVALHENRIENSVQPLSTISLNGDIIGYEMTYDEDDISFDKMFLFRRQLIRALKETSEILKYFASQDITYGDVKANNILINRKTKKAKFCDMDNIRYKEYPIDLLSDHVDSFITLPGDLEEKADAYMHNLMTLQMLNSPNLTYDEILYQLSEGKFPRCYKKQARETLATMASSEPFTGEYIAQYIKR